MKTKTAQETESFGRSLAARLRAGDVLLLRGDLGAGKTTLARGIARGLGVGGAVTSPTFTLLCCHEGRIPLRHFDLYRLSDEDEFESAGLSDAIGSDAVSLIEWPERCEGAMPEKHLEVRIDYGADPDERRITLTPRGGFREGFE